MKKKAPKKEAPKAAWTEVKPPVAYGIEPFEIDGEIVAYQVRGPRIIAHRTDAGDALTLCRMLQNAHDAGYDAGRATTLTPRVEWRKGEEMKAYEFKAEVPVPVKAKKKGAKNG